MGVNIRLYEGLNKTSIYWTIRVINWHRRINIKICQNRAIKDKIYYIELTNRVTI